MYVLKTVSRTCNVLGCTVDQHIYEMTARELREAQATDTRDDDGNGVNHRRIDPDHARRLIGGGVNHSTGLWHDGERWRYAKADPTGC